MGKARDPAPTKAPAWGLFDQSSSMMLSGTGKCLRLSLLIFFPGIPLQELLEEMFLRHLNPKEEVFLQFHLPCRGTRQWQRGTHDASGSRAA